MRREQGTGQRKQGRSRFFLIACLLFPLSGCHFTTFPDPNDPNAAGLKQPEVLRRQLKGASDALLTREIGGEITDARYHELLSAYAEELLKDTDIEEMEPGKAWEYGEVFRTAGRWKETEALFRIAAKVSPNEDRRVNDRLRLAEALAHLGRVPEAIAQVRETFSAPPGAKAPILYGVLLELVPAGRGKGKDVELARLLEDAIRQSELVEVDRSTAAGRAFYQALPFHQRDARELAARLYLSAGRSADVERVLGGKSPTLHV